MPASQQQLPWVLSTLHATQVLPRGSSASISNVTALPRAFGPTTNVLRGALRWPSDTVTFKAVTLLHIRDDL